jgi:membrane-associated phospholipid phosphatase
LTARRRRHAALAAALTAATLGDNAAAQQVEASPIDVDLAIDLPLTLSVFVLGGALFGLRHEIVRERCAPNCDRSQLPPFDAELAGQRNDAAHAAGNALILVNLGLPHALGVVDHVTNGGSWSTWAEDRLIIAETLGISVALHQLTSLATQRARPFAYGPTSADDRQSPDTYLSFYSGHTANSFAVASAYSYLFSLRHPHSRWRLPVWTLTHGLAALEGYLRITSGRHFPSDVIVGAVIGSSVGLIVPHLHRSGIPRIKILPLQSGAGLGYSGDF